MTISIECPFCGTNIYLKNQILPRYIICPNCKEKITFKKINIDVRKEKK